MRILVVNDDGVESDGIIALAAALQPLGEVVVVAPDRERSGWSHAISAMRGVAIVPVEGRAVRTFACTGSPADCVVLGVDAICDGAVDLVASGINRGANLGDDVNYSGTVAGGIEGLLMGARALAVSLGSSWPRMDAVHHWATAGALAHDVARELLARPREEVLWNLNVPNVALERLPGVLPTRQGRKRYRERIEIGEDGATYGYVHGTVEAEDDTPQTDLGAMARGYASLTPLRLDRTAHQALASAEALVPRGHRAAGRGTMSCSDYGASRG